jgi:hypothetical protein
MVLKSKAEARANFEAAVAYIPSRYEAGVKKADWQTPASSEQAEKNFAAEMSKVISEKRRQAGVKAVSNADWQNAAVTKGAPIIGDRIRAALGKWEAEWGPMYDQVVSTVGTLPAKTTDWRANVNNRLMKVVETWRKAAGKA